MDSASAPAPAEQATTASAARPDAVALMIFGALVLIGGASAVGIRFSNRELEPLWGAGVRWALAALIVFCVALARRVPLPRGRSLAGAVVLGLLTPGVANSLAYWGLVEAPAGLATVLLSLAPLITFLLAIAHRQEAFRGQVLAGALLAAGGIAVMSSGSIRTGVPLLSLLALIGATVCLGEGTVIAKWLPRSHPLATTAVAASSGSAVLLLLSRAAGEPWTIPAQAATQGALAFLILGGSVGFFLLYLAILRRWTASAVAYQFVLWPLVAVGLSAWLDDEPVTWTLLLGGAVVLAGVYVGALRRQGASAAARPTPSPPATRVTPSAAADL
ncbi:MAG TPA: EamA family transporter [Egibacteraceae bacterium]|nr:EamA family transporter [Egibacteraceae bacterium]